MILPNEPRTIEIDARDWNSWRSRICELELQIKQLEERHRHSVAQLALFMNGTKERFDVFSLLLDGLKSSVGGKDVE